MLATGGFALGPGRIVIEDSLRGVLPDILSRYGPRAGIVAGRVGHDLLRADLGEQWPPAEATVWQVDGQCSAAEIERVAAWAADRDVIVGVGGGKVLDVAKAAADLAHRPVITVPTSAATCAAAATLSVLYGDDGSFASSRQVATVATMAVPRRIVASAPPRLLVAGVFDALAKLPELEWQIGDLLAEPATLPYASGLAHRGAGDIFGLLLQRMETWQEQGFGTDGGTWRETFADDHAVLAATVGAAMVTGTQPPTHAGVGHALYYQHRNRIGQPALLHGEVVGTGIALQLIMNGAPDDQVTRYRRLLATYGLPTDLDERVADRLDEEFYTRWAGYCHAEPEQLVAAVSRLDEPVDAGR